MNRVEIDPILREFGWNADRIAQILANRDRSHKMDRRERMIFRLEREVLNSKRWAKMKKKVDIGVPTREDPNLRLVKTVKQRNSNWGAIAGSYLEINDFGGQLSGKSLKRLIAHEMIHYYLMDNKAERGTRKTAYQENAFHGRMFRECAAVLIDSRQNPTMYQYSCPCGWWIRFSGKRRAEIFCQSCNKRLVTKTEHARLKKVAAIGSRLHRIDLSRYAVMTVKRKDGKQRPSLGRKA